jgi:Domain of unknown function (DUF222)/HNH endonuclease
MCAVDVAALSPALAPLDGLVESFDQLAREDPLDLPSSLLGEQIAGLFMLRSRMDAEIARRVAVFDRTRGFAAFDAHSSCAWLRGTVRLSPNAASEQVRVARQLDRLPEVGSAFAAGEVNLQHVQTITRVLEEAPAEVAREAGPSLVQLAQRVDPHRLGAVTRHLRHTFAPEAVVRDEAQVRERRRLHLSESMDGVYYLDGVLDTETGAMLRTALDSLMGPPARDDERSWPQRRHDAFGDLVRRQLDSGELPQVGGQRPHLTLTASVETLARMPGSKAADLDWGSPVSAEFLRRVACDSELTCILIDDTGDPLSVGRTSRTFTPAQRRALVARDRCCVLCGRPAAWCHSHHIEHWIDGGETSVANAALVCGRCHHRLHEGGCRLVRKPDRTWTAIRGPLPP